MPDGFFAGKAEASQVSIEVKQVPFAVGEVVGGRTGSGLMGTGKLTGIIRGSICSTLGRD